MSVLGIGFSSYCGDDPHFEQLTRNLDQASELGVEFVELPVFSMDLVAGGRILPAQVRRLKAVIEGRGLRYTLHGPIAANLMTPKPMAARHETVLKAYIELAADLKAPHLIMHTGVVVGGRDKPDEVEAGYATQRETLARLGEFAAHRNVILAVENVFTMRPEDYTALPSTLARELAAIDHPHVRGCLDFSHAAIRCYNTADFLHEVQALAPWVKHLHIHDSFGDSTTFPSYSRSERVAYGIGDLHLPIGWGNLPWDAIMSTCAFQPDAIFNLELPTPYIFALPDCITAVRGMKATYEQARLR